MLDLGSSDGCVQCTDAAPKAGERCCNKIANVISPARDKECAGLNRLTSLDLSRNNMDGALPLSLLLNQDLNSIHLEGNKFEYPDAEEDEAALDALVRLCNRPGMDCDGLPPTNCDAFGSKLADGSDDGSTYMVRVDNPNRCLRCEDVVLPIVMISVACVVVVVGMGLYIFLIRKYRHHLKKWVSTVAIFFTHLQTIGIVGNLKLHWPPPVEATMAWATFSVFENTETLRPECLVKDLYGVSPFFLFSIMMAAAIAMVMIGAVSLSFVVSSLRARVLRPPPRHDRRPVHRPVVSRANLAAAQLKPAHVDRRRAPVRWPPLRLLRARPRRRARVDRCGDRHGVAAAAALAAAVVGRARG